MKIYKVILCCLFALCVGTATKAQTRIDRVNIQTFINDVQEDVVIFDIYFSACEASEVLYLGTSDIRFVLSENFIAPILSTYTEGSSVAYSNFVAANSDSEIVPLLYSIGVSVSSIDNEIVINLNAPTVTTQEDFNNKIAAIDHQSETHRLGRFMITGYTGTGQPEFELKTSGGGLVTEIFAFENARPFNQYQVAVKLPISLTEFKALPKNNQVHLNWTTHTEVNSSHFEVQHSTTNRDWQTLWRIDAAGNSLQLLDYEHIHHSPVIGDNYYRLKMIDLDGSYEYSDTEVVRFKRSDNRLTIYPNPTNGEFTVALGVEARHPVQLSVIDATGRMIYTEETILNGTQNAIIDLSHVAKGTYLVTVKTDKEQFAKWLIIY